MSVFATLAEVLECHLEAGTIKRFHIARAARVSESTVARWVHGETQPNFDESMTLIEKLPRVVSDSIRELIPPANDIPSKDLDLNHDYTVGMDDALQGAIESGRMQQDALEQIHKAIQAGVTLSSYQRLQITDTIAEQMRMLAKMQQIIGKCGLKVAK